MNQHISLCIISKNEQDNISKHFKWLKDVKTIDEVILVDDFSTDKTVDILKSQLGQHQQLHVYKRKLADNFSQQRTFLISKAKNNWILWLDPDEKPTKEFVDFLNEFEFSKYISACSFVRQDIFWGQPLRHGQNSNYHTRLFDKTKGKFVGQVHEVWQTSNACKLSYRFQHYSCQNLTQIIEKINRYSSIRAQELYHQHYQTSLFQIIFYPIAKFTQNYLFKLGLLDGIRGIIFSLLMSFHSFLVRSKLWHLSKTSSST